jgi:hypothetical protein
MSPEGYRASLARESLIEALHDSERVHPITVSRRRVKGDTALCMITFHRPSGDESYKITVTEEPG